MRDTRNDTRLNIVPKPKKESTGYVTLSRWQARKILMLLITESTGDELISLWRKMVGPADLDDSNNAIEAGLAAHIGVLLNIGSLEQ